MFFLTFKLLKAMKLNEHLKNLPNHSVDIDLWENVEATLSQDASLSERLPQHKAESDLWYQIEDRLRQPRRRLLFRKYTSIAASIAVLLTLGSIYITKSHINNDLYYSEEIIDISTSFPEIKRADVFKKCEDYPTVCETPDFTKLKTMLEEQNREEKKIKMLRKASDNQQLEILHSRIIKNIQQLESQMNQMFS
jgi:hypothetical protein